jgi:imidazolonepropionase
MTLIINIKHLFQVEHTEQICYVKGAAMQTLTTIDNAYLYIENGLITDFGAMSNLPEAYFSQVECVINAQGLSALPTWCDSHTHIVYAGSREKEFVLRIKGATYEEIAAAGGGILNSAKLLAETPEEVLFEQAFGRVQEMIAMGTGAIEIKSGYGLSVEGELKMLRVIQQLKSKVKVPIRANFLGAHALPLAYKQDRAAYIRLLTDTLLPQIAEEGLADFIDVFCDRGFFTVEETATILAAGAKYNLRPKIHANELAYSGGIQVGVEYGALSVDHLECVGNAEISCLLASETMPTLLPSTAFFLNLTYAPARKMIDAGLPVALATDYNPGSSPSGNMPLILSLACTQMKMLPEESVHAATINGAYAMGLERELGTIARGKRANLQLLSLPSLAYLPYSFGSRLVEKVLLDGEVVVGR